LDTVLGLSLTSTAVGWVLVEGRDADGAILDHDEFEVRTGGGMRAVNTSEQATAAVLRAQSVTTRDDQRLHVIGVTWSDEAAAEAALLLESLADAGFDNVVPVRLRQASEMLARGIAPVVGYEKAAICVLDGDSTTVVMVDDRDGEQEIATKHVPGGDDRLVQWLATMFDRSSWQPGSVVVVGADHDVEALSRQLEKAVPVPVVAQTGPEVALARGAALASAENTEFTDSEMVETIDRKRLERGGSPQRTYAGAMTLLVAGAVTFVASLSLAVGPRLVPDRAPEPVHQVVHKSTSPVAQAPTPSPAAVKVPARKPAPEPAPSEQPAAAPPPAEPESGASAEVSPALPAAEPMPPPAPAPGQLIPPPEPPPPNPHPLLTKVFERLHGHPGDPAPGEPAPPQGPLQPNPPGALPPPNPGALPPP
jgi:hypothetical protein